MVQNRLKINSFRFALFASFLLHLLVIIWGDLWYWFNPPATSFPVSVEIVSSSEIARAQSAARDALSKPKPAPTSEEVPPEEAPPEEAPSEKVLPEKKPPEKKPLEKKPPEKKPEDNLSKAVVKKAPKPALSREMEDVFDAIQGLEDEDESPNESNDVASAESTQPEAPPSENFDNLLSEALGVDSLSPDESDSSLIGREDVFSSNILTAAEQIRLRSQLAQCWSPPAGGFSAEAVIVEIRLILNADATIRKITVLPPSRAQDDKLYRLAVENARRALLDPTCIPLKLPEGKYNLWQETILRFSPASLSG